MRLALLSDIHSNVAALEAVLDSVRTRGVDAIWCLGDTVGYNANPNECLDLLDHARAKLLLGNHDWAATVGEPIGFNPVAVAGVEHARRVLRPAHRTRLSTLSRSLEIIVEGKRVIGFHGSPRDPLMEYVFPKAPERVLRDLARVAGDPAVVALGHTHLPMQQEAGETLIVNPGSVGQPRDGDPRASFGILEMPKRRFEIVRTAYNVDATAAANKAAGLPEASWKRLYRGV